MTSQEHTIRDATESDAAACAAVYAPYVATTAITFETQAPSVAEMAGRIADAQRKHAWLVLEVDQRVVGYAYAHQFAPRAAYRWSCEASVYLEPGRRRTGGGRALYQVLFPRLAERGYSTVIAGLTVPNEASTALHRSMGFEPVGTYRRIGYKNGQWHDVAWFQKDLATTADPPAEPR